MPVTFLLMLNADFVQKLKRNMLKDDCNVFVHVVLVRLKGEMRCRYLRLYAKRFSKDDDHYCDKKQSQ